MPPLITYHVGLTLNTNPERNEYLKVDLEIKDIDSELPIMEQLERVHKALHPAMQWIDTQLAAKVDQHLGGGKK